MIRLIAADLDGSLLPDDKRVPEEFFRLLPELEKRGISFFTASGRTFHTLYHNFAPVADRIGYICENGACVVMDGKTIISHTINPVRAQGIFEAAKLLPDVQLVLCGKKSAYHLDYPQRFHEHTMSYHVNHTVISDYAQARDEFYKIAVCDLRGPENNSFPFFKERFGQEFGMFISGKYWMDIMVPSVNKGKALAQIQQLLSVHPDETLAFGDYYNDVELLQQAGYGYVMKNAADGMKKHAKLITPHTNNENGVLEVIRKHVFGES